MKFGECSTMGHNLQYFGNTKYFYNTKFFFAYIRTAKKKKKPFTRLSY